MIEITNQEFELFKAYLLQHCGINIPPEKKYLFNTRLDKIMCDGQYENFMQLYNKLAAGRLPQLASTIIEVMTTNETSFFRDTHPFQTLEEVLLPAIGESKLKESGPFFPVLRIWSAACSTGQEPLSIAMVVAQWLKKTKGFSPAQVQILATDISYSVLARAQAGVYTDSEVAKGLEEPYKSFYLEAASNGWAPVREIKQMVSFRQLNLSRPFPPEFNRLDLIFCRNVIIYLSARLKAELMAQFYARLNPGGILILGAAENLYGVENSFVSEHVGSTTLYRAVKNG